MVEKIKPHKTKTGKVLTDADIAAMADEADHTMTSEIIREALRRSLDVA